MFPGIKWIPVPSGESTLFGTSWDVLQQLKQLLLMLMSLWNNQRFKFVDKLASQCVCTQSVRPWSIQFPLGAKPLYLQVLHSSQRVPRLTVGDRVHAGGCYFAFPSSFCFHRTCHCPFQQWCYAWKHLQTFVPVHVQWGRGCLWGTVWSALSEPHKCWARKPLRGPLRKSGNKSWALSIHFRLNYWLWKRKRFEILVSYQTIIADCR